MALLGSGRSSRLQSSLVEEEQLAAWLAVELGEKYGYRNAQATVLAPTGTLVMVGGSGGSWTMGYGTTIRALVRNLLTKQTLTTLISKPNAEDLGVLADMLAAGDITPAIDRTFTLDETVDALEHVGSRHTSGKSIVTV